MAELRKLVIVQGDQLDLDAAAEAAGLPLDIREDRHFFVSVRAFAAHAKGRKALPLTVLYDGACPLCRREIGLYRRLRPNAPLCFADLSDPTQPLPPDSTREQLLARFHVRRSDGELLSGAQAFLALWAALPGWRWLARAGRLPGAAWVLERIYRLFLRGRPALQSWASRLARTGD